MPLSEAIFARFSENAKDVDGDSLIEARRGLLEHWAEHPWNFLQGKDLDGSPIIHTTDERDKREPVKVFPDWPYLEACCRVLHSSEVPVFMSKTRQLMASHLVLMMGAWSCAFIEGRGIPVSKSTEGEAKKLLTEKVRNTWARLPDWVRQALPIAPEPAARIDFLDTTSYMLGCTANAAVRACRGGTASIVIIDEAAFQEDLPELYSAALAMAAQMWLVTTQPTQATQERTCSTPTSSQQTRRSSSLAEYQPGYEWPDSLSLGKKGIVPFGACVQCDGGPRCGSPTRASRTERRGYAESTQTSWPRTRAEPVRAEGPGPSAEEGQRSCGTRTYTVLASGAMPVSFTPAAVDRSRGGTSSGKVRIGPWSLIH